MSTEADLNGATQGQTTNLKKIFKSKRDRIQERVQDKLQEQLKKKSTKAPSQPGFEQQETHKAGLFVSKEYGKATARCKAKVQAIAKECRASNRRFRDLGFDFESHRRYCLHGPDFDPEAASNFTPAATRRVTQIFDKPQFFVEGLDYSDIVQGQLGDCWFLSALAAVGTKPGLIEKLCVDRDEMVGVYGFVFCRDGEYSDVIIDDQLFVVTPRWEALPFAQRQLYHQDRDAYENTSRKGSKTLYFARSADDNETWVPLIEKAFAKFHGDYQAIVGGETNEGIEDLTGGISESIYLNDILDTELFWEKELKRADDDLLFSCAVMDPKGVEVYLPNIKGIITGHAYAILMAVEFRGKKFLKIRNPWGESEWNGRWSDGSKEWDGEWLEALKILKHKFGDDGVFIMEYGDFLTHFESVERTQLFDDTWVQSSHWLNVKTRPLPAAWQWGDVSFTFSLPSASEAILALSQSDTRFYRALESAAEWSMDFKVFKQGAKHPIGSSTFSTGLTRTVTMRTDELPAGDYVVHVRLDRDYNGARLNNITTNINSWDDKKMAKVWAQFAHSKSIAANFDAKTWQSHLEVPLETFGGKDVLTVLAENQAAGSEKRKLLMGKLAAAKQAQAQATQAMEQKGEENETGEAEAEAEPEAEAEAEAEETAEGEEGADAEVEVEAAGGEPVEEEDERPVHEGIGCDGCHDSPIVGNRWKCMVCPNYDLCDSCHAAEVHEEDHQMLKVEHPDDMFENTNFEFADNISTVLLGFRVYSKSNAPVQISGQLSNGQAIKWKKRE